MAQKNSFDYAAKSAELERIVAELQNPDIDIAAATKLHETGVKLADELETYLKQAEITVRTHVAD
ncbi:MAG TPA: exodeoxyribonuclease VII small subunit [Candidatus Saccharimonadales bacterium]|nr:exodeoxyribonuclease VII small subunit [Candidatus Saccharimonadales bacterium]